MDSPTGTTYTEFRNGYHFFGGYTSPFYEHRKETVEFTNPLILIAESQVNDARQIAPDFRGGYQPETTITDYWQWSGNRSAATLLVNRLQVATAVVNLVASPQLQDFVQNLSVLTGAAIHHFTLGAELKVIGPTILGKLNGLLPPKRIVLLLAAPAIKTDWSGKAYFSRRKPQTIRIGRQEFSGLSNQPAYGGTATILCWWKPLLK